MSYFLHNQKNICIKAAGIKQREAAGTVLFAFESKKNRPRCFPLLLLAPKAI